MKATILCLCILIGSLVAIPPKGNPLLEGKPNPEELGDDFEGDIKFPPGRNGILGESYRWPNGIIPYVYASGFAEDKKTVVRRAMDDLQAGTDCCIGFVERTTETDYVEFIDTQSSCWSYVGRIGGKQQVSYPQWCIDKYGSVQHELLHSIGFFHEQSRSDRDTYVTINLQNAQSGSENNFNKYDNSFTSFFDVPYDYGSVLHYSAKAFSTNGLPTIVPTDSAYLNLIGQRVGASASDLLKVKKMYNCGCA